MLVAELQLYEAHVVAVFRLQVGRIGAAKRLQVQTGREAEFVDQVMHPLPEVACGHQSTFLGGEQVSDRLAVAGKSTFDPVSDCLGGLVEHGQHRALFGW